MANNFTSIESKNAIESYKGEWGFEQAAHLARRASYGSSAKQIRELANLGMEKAIDQLLADIPQPAPPLNYAYKEDPFVPVGSTWVYKPYDRSNMNIEQYRRRSLYAWTIDNLFSGQLHIREKITLFWHNHFVIQNSVVKDPVFIYDHFKLLRENALGNFKHLTKAIVIDPSMLRYLNGNQNTKASPNENFARELLELFTIGKGALAGSGDYSTFTEQDVREMARSLTGWVDSGYYGRNDGPVLGYFVQSRHDREGKKLSHRFENAEISDLGAQEYSHLIDIIFKQDEVARFISRKLYRWLVYYKIDQNIEDQIITPMADLIRSSDYEILPAIRMLLSSTHFYSVDSIGPMIKNPIDFLSSIFNQFKIKFPEDPVIAAEIKSRLSGIFEPLQMNYYEPPNVAGWKAYYQEPLYYRSWISSVTLNARQQLSSLLVSGNIRVQGFTIAVDVLDYIKDFEDPLDPNAMIDEFIRNLMPYDLSPEQKVYLKEILIPGLPDFEWTVEYSMHLNNPDDSQVKKAVETKLRAFVTAIISLPEFHLS